MLILLLPGYRLFTSRFPRAPLYEEAPHQQEDSMPRGNRTGPTGMGPMTGRGAGFCAGYDVPGYENPMPGFRGQGRGWGRGRGWRNRYYATGLPRWARFWDWGPATPTQVTKEAETESLKAQAEWLGEQLEAIQSRLAELQE